MCDLLLEYNNLTLLYVSSNLNLISRQQASRNSSPPRLVFRISRRSRNKWIGLWHQTKSSQLDVSTWIPSEMRMRISSRVIDFRRPVLLHLNHEGFLVCNPLQGTWEEGRFCTQVVWEKCDFCKSTKDECRVSSFFHPHPMKSSECHHPWWWEIVIPEGTTWYFWWRREDMTWKKF